MSQRQGTINQCDICGHEWLPNPMMALETNYTHCTSGKCRSRRWNKNGTVAHVDRARSASEAQVVMPSVATQVGEVAGSTPAVPPVKMNDAMARFMATSIGIVSKAPFEEPMPAHTPYCRECDSCMAGKEIKGRGMVYACADVACPMYGMEQNPR